MSTQQAPPKETAKLPVPTPTPQIQPTSQPLPTPPPATTSAPPPTTSVPPPTTSAPPPTPTLSLDQQLALAKEKARQTQPSGLSRDKEKDNPPVRKSSTSSHHSTHSNRSDDEDYSGRKSRTYSGDKYSEKEYSRSGDKYSYEKSKDDYGSRPSSSHSRHSQSSHRSDYDRPRSRDQARRPRSRSRDRGEKERRRSRTPPSPKKKTSDSSLRSEKGLKRDRETTQDDVPRPAPVPVPKPALNWQLAEDGFDWASGREKAIPGKQWKLIEPNWSSMSRDNGYLTTNAVTQQIERELAVEKIKEHVNSLVADGTISGELLIYVIVNDHGYHLNPYGTAETVYHWTLTFASSTKKRLTYTGTKPALNILHVRFAKAAYWERLTADLAAKKRDGWIDQTAFANASAHLKSLPK